MLNFSEVRKRFVLSKSSVCHMEMVGFNLEEGLCFFCEYACDSDNLKSGLGVKIQLVLLVHHNFIDSKCCSLCLLCY